MLTWKQYYEIPKLDSDPFFSIGFLSYLNFGPFCKGPSSLIASFSIFSKLKCAIFIDFLRKKKEKINLILGGWDQPPKVVTTAIQ